MAARRPFARAITGESEWVILPFGKTRPAPQALRNEHDLPGPAPAVLQHRVRKPGLRQAEGLADMGVQFARIDQLGKAIERS
jgi:hypothetical protein